jgi:trimeric autotransporter adhesin
MKSPRFSATNLDRSKKRQNKLSRALFTTTFIAGSHLLAVMSASATPPPTPAQPSPVVPTRTILNGSFEQPVLNNGAGYIVPESYNYATPVIWRTTEKVTPYTDALEVWRGVNTGAGGQPATSGAGSQHAELNGSSNASLYQDVCVLPGETVGWSLLHAARKNGTTNLNPTNIMQVSITDPSIWSNSKTPPGTKLYNSGNLSTSYNDGWQLKTGTWNSTNASIQPLRFAFEAIQGSNGNITYGNFIDDVKLDLAPLIDFLPTNGGNVNLASTIEGNPTPANPPHYYLSLRINGIMKTAGSVKINLTGLNAGRHYTLGSVLKGNAAVTGLSATKVDNQVTLNIPAGTYDANVTSNYIHIPIDFSDTIKQADDNLTFFLFGATGGGVAGVTTGNLTVNSTDCSSAARDRVNTLLRDDDYIERVQLPINVAAYRSK